MVLDRLVLGYLQLLDEPEIERLTVVASLQASLLQLPILSIDQAQLDVLPDNSISFDVRPRADLWCKRCFHQVKCSVEQRGHGPVQGRSALEFTTQQLVEVRLSEVFRAAGHVRMPQPCAGSLGRQEEAADRVPPVCSRADSPGGS